MRCCLFSVPGRLCQHDDRFGKTQFGHFSYGDRVSNSTVKIRFPADQDGFRYKGKRTRSHGCRKNFVRGRRLEVFGFSGFKTGNSCKIAVFMGEKSIEIEKIIFIGNFAEQEVHAEKRAFLQKTTKPHVVGPAAVVDIDSPRTSLLAGKIRKRMACTC